MKLETVGIHTEFCIVGGGMAGLFAAVSAARHGIKTVLMQERPVLGGNASSEIRMWICGANGRDNRETGLLEELALQNLYYNPYKLWPQWDALLYGMALKEENLTLLLNTSCMDAQTEGDRIVSVTGWQMTTQRFICVEADLFADCSGDSILAPLTGAQFRLGREPASEFGEETSTVTEDRKTMGLSCLIGGRELDHPVSYRAPEWAVHLTKEDLKRRRPNIQNSAENFWYLELGGDRDSIRDTEEIRNDLVKLAYGMWDALKNSGEFPEAANLQLDFVCFLPGKRESRRMVGDYLMTQLDVADGGHFPDVVAFGGWPLDDHDPRGFWFKGNGCLQIQSKSPFGIPYRSLYSVNIQNLFFAGRNISMTHAAMSSTRVMATCALEGQAVGTAAAIARKYKVNPREVYYSHLRELQQTLMEDDCFLPYNIRSISETAQKAVLSCSMKAEGLENLRNGIDRNNHTYGDQDQGCTMPLGAVLEYRMEEMKDVSEIRMVFDSDLNRDTLPGDRNEQMHMTRANVLQTSPVMCMPGTLVKKYEVSVHTAEGWKVVCAEEENIARLVRIPVKDQVDGIRLSPVQLWDENAARIHLFSFDFR